MVVIQERHSPMHFLCHLASSPANWGTTSGALSAYEQRTPRSADLDLDFFSSTMPTAADPGAAPQKTRAPPERWSHFQTEYINQLPDDTPGATTRVRRTSTPTKCLQRHSDHCMHRGDVFQFVFTPPSSRRPHYLFLYARCPPKTIRTVRTVLPTRRGPSYLRSWITHGTRRAHTKKKRETYRNHIPCRVFDSLLRHELVFSLYLCSHMNLVIL